MNFEWVDGSTGILQEQDRDSGGADTACGLGLGTLDFGL